LLTIIEKVSQFQITIPTPRSTRRIAEMARWRAQPRDEVDMGLAVDERFRVTRQDAR
jgi:hypothetical protein